MIRRPATNRIVEEFDSGRSGPAGCGDVGGVGERRRCLEVRTVIRGGEMASPSFRLCGEIGEPTMDNPSL